MATGQQTTVKAIVRYVLRGSVIVDIPRDVFDAIDEDETSDAAVALMDELAGSVDLHDGINEGEIEWVSEHKPATVSDAR